MKNNEDEEDTKKFILKSLENTLYFFKKLKFVRDKFVKNHKKIFLHYGLVKEEVVIREKTYL